MSSVRLEAKFRLGAIVRIFLVVPLLFVSLKSQSGLSAELSVESTVEVTPPELQNFAQRAKSLRLRLNELEKKMARAQSSILSRVDKDLIDFRLDLKPQSKGKVSSISDNVVVVSHVRMSIDGRPFVYTQSALVIGEKNPLPLFLGKITEGEHQIRLQFQTSPVNPELFSMASAAWRTVDQVFSVNLTNEAGQPQRHTIYIADVTQDSVSVKANITDSPQVVIQEVKPVEKSGAEK